MDMRSRAWSSERTTHYFRQIRAFSRGLPDSGDRRARRWLVVRISGWRLWGRGSGRGRSRGLPPVFCALIWRGRMLVSLAGAAVEFWEVLAGQALIGSLIGQAGRCEVDSGRPAGISAGGFPRVASRTRRASRPGTGLSASPVMGVAVVIHLLAGHGAGMAVPR